MEAERPIPQPITGIEAVLGWHERRQAHAAQMPGLQGPLLSACVLPALPF